MPSPSRRNASPLGQLLRHWRADRRLSQLDLALQAGLSARHLSFIETGRTEPSREMVLRLANALDLPLVERNALLAAAGYAAVHPCRSLDSVAMERVRSVLTLILDKHMPYPAVAMTRMGQVVLANRATLQLFAFLRVSLPPGEPNMMRAILEPGELRSCIVDWENIARIALRRLWRDAQSMGGDQALLDLLGSLQRLPGVPTDWRRVSPSADDLPYLTFAFERHGQRLSWLSTMTTFGTPQDVFLQGLYIESFFPADGITEERWQTIAEANGECFHELRP